jgi:hypothetical protein
MVYPGGRDVGQDEVAFDFVCSQHAIEQAADAGKPFAFLVSAEEGFHFSHGDVFEEAECPLRRQQSAKFRGNLFDQRHWEIIERQAGNDEVVGFVFGQFLDAGVDELDSAGDRLKRFIVPDSIT